MNDETPHRFAQGGPSLREALRLARVEAAERGDVVIDLRQAEIARLEILQEALAPVFASAPPEVDLFDVGLAPGEKPRLFVDMVSFVEMGRDRKVYRFMRDGRYGLTVAAESEEIGPIAEAVTSYVARRLVERERLLADDDRIAALDREAQARSGAQGLVQPTPPTAAAAAQVSLRESAPPAVAPKRPFWLRALAVLAAFGAGGALGAVVVVALIAAVAKGYIPGP